MKKILPYLVAALIVLPVVIGLLIRFTETYRFGRNAAAAAAPSLQATNMIRWEQLAAMKTKTLVVDLSDTASLILRKASGTIHIPAAHLLDRASLDTLKAHRKETRILYSPDAGVSAKAWMVLSQMGYRNLYILADDPDQEKLKFPFQPEPVVQAETE
jgi:hypothetical protein